MPMSHALSALIDKRSELSGEIAGLEGKLGQLRADLVHIDAAIRMFDPTFKPYVIAPKSQRERAGWFPPSPIDGTSSPAWS